MMPEKIEVVDAYKWLNKFNEDKKGFLGNPIESLLAQVKEAVAKRNYPGAVYYIDIAVDVSESMGNSLEQAETHFECGLSLQVI